MLKIQKEVNKILSSAGFELRKYLSNKPDLCNQFYYISKSLDASVLNLGENENNKTLGVYWNAHSNQIEYRVRNFTEFDSVIKRSILPIIGQIFDILGLSGPVILTPKIILQNLS